MVQKMRVQHYIHSAGSRPQEEQYRSIARIKTVEMVGEAAIAFPCRLINLRDQCKSVISGHPQANGVPLINSYAMEVNMSSFGCHPEGTQLTTSVSVEGGKPIIWQSVWLMRCRSWCRMHTFVAEVSAKRALASWHCRQGPIRLRGNGSAPP